MTVDLASRAAPLHNSPLFFFPDVGYEDCFAPAAAMFDHHLRTLTCCGQTTSHAGTYVNVSASTSDAVGAQIQV
jgi:hypothetical protein